MKIGLDFDGVIADSGELKSIAAEKLFNIHIPKNEFKKETVVDGGILTLDQYRLIQKEVYNNLEIGLLMEPVKDVFQFIQRLRDEGHEVVVITSRYDDSLAVAQSWAEKHGLTITFMSAPYPQSKESAALTASIDVFIDDDLEKLVELKNSVKHRFLFSWEYNSSSDEKPFATRVHSWQQFYAEIQKLV